MARRAATTDRDLALAASQISNLTGVIKGAKLGATRNAIMSASSQGYTCVVKRVNPDTKKADGRSIVDLKRQNKFRVECVSIDPGPEASHTYLILWGASASATGANKDGRLIAKVPSPASERTAAAIDVDDGFLFRAATVAAEQVKMSLEHIRSLDSKKSTTVRNAVLAAARQGYTSTLVRVERDSKDMTGVKELHATGRFEAVMVAFDPGPKNDCSFLLRWGTSLPARGGAGDAKETHDSDSSDGDSDDSDSDSDGSGSDGDSEGGSDSGSGARDRDQDSDRDRARDRGPSPDTDPECSSTDGSAVSNRETDRPVLNSQEEIRRRFMPKAARAAAPSELVIMRRKDLRAMIARASEKRRQGSATEATA